MPGVIATLRGATSHGIVIIRSRTITFGLVVLTEARVSQLRTAAMITRMGWFKGHG